MFICKLIINVCVSILKSISLFLRCLPYTGRVLRTHRYTSDNTLPRSCKSMSVVTNSLVRPSCLFRTVWVDIHTLKQLDREYIVLFSFLTQFPVLFTTPHYTKLHTHTHIYMRVYLLSCVCISSVIHSRMSECNWYNCQNNDHMCQSVQYNVSLFPSSVLSHSFVLSLLLSACWVSSA